MFKLALLCTIFNCFHDFRISLIEDNGFVTLDAAEICPGVSSNTASKFLVRRFYFTNFLQVLSVLHSKCFVKA